MRGGVAALSPLLSSVTLCSGSKLVPFWFQVGSKLVPSAKRPLQSVISLGLSETRLPESMGTVEYTGLTVEAANYLHTMHITDETRTKKSATPMCEMISEFLCHCSVAFQDMYFLYLTTKDMSAFKPRLGLLTNEQGAKMQYRAYMMANKYYGMCEIVSGKNYLRYKTEQIVNKMREAVARTIKLSDTVKACDKMAIENAEREYEIIKRKRPSEK